MAAAQKKKQKMKGKTLNLTEFLGGDTGGGGGYVMSHKPVSWAEEVENAGDDHDDDYGTGSSSSNVNRAVLPTAPRSARGPAVDLTKVPSEPPFTAFLGNLPFDASEEEIEKFFHPLVVKNIRIPPGRSKGFGYAEFEDRQSLLEALERNDRTLKNRQIRIDLADQHGGERDRSDRERDWGRGRRDDDGEDKTQGDWRRAPRSDDRGMDRDSDRFGNRDRYGDRGGFRDGGDRYGDRGGGRFGDRDRGSFGDRGGDRFGDRGGDRYGDRGGDRYGDRGGDRYGDRGGDRYGDRGGDRYGDRGGDRFGDRRGGDRYGDDRGYGRRSFGSGYGRDDRDSPRGGFDRGPPRDDRYEGPSDSSGPKERPRLNLQPRTKPKEEDTADKPSKPAAAPASSIFGAAKPVDTAAREREIEERILREKKEEEDRWEQERENRLRDVKERERKNSEGRPDKITRQDSDSSSQGRQRKLSSSSSLGKGIRTVAPPPGVGSARVRRDSALSDEYDDENVFDEDKSLSPKSPPSKKDETPTKLVPAPPPKENVWAVRRDQTRSVDKEDHDKENKENANRVTSPSNKSAKPADDSAHDSKNNVKKQNFAPAEPPKENAWLRRKQESSEDNFKGKHWGDKRTTPNKPASQEQNSRAKRRDKPLPTSIDEMPKYEEKQAIDISDTNKFGFLADEDAELSDD